MAERRAESVAPTTAGALVEGEGVEASTDRRRFLRLATGGAVAAAVGGAVAEPAGANHVFGSGGELLLGHDNEAWSTTTRVLAREFNDETPVIDVQADHGMVAIRASGQRLAVRFGEPDGDEWTSSPSIGLWGEVDSALAPGDPDGDGVSAPTTAGVYAVGRGTAFGLHARADTGTAVVATAQGTAVEAEGRTGVVGRSTDNQGHGITGENEFGTAIRGAGIVGVHGASSDPAGHGLQGENANGTAVRGEGLTGVHGRSADANGRGVHGENTAGDGVRGDGRTGVHGRSEDPAGQGVRGENAVGDAVRGEGKTGVHGRSEDAEGHGVHGENASGDAVRGEGKTGVHGRSSDAAGHGVHGENANGAAVKGEGKTGVHGRSSDAAGHGVHGENANGVGVRANGKTAVEAHAPQGGVGIRSVVGQQASAAQLASAPAIQASLAVAENPAVSVGILAIAEVGMEITGTQTAMHVRGKACFDATGRSGRSNGTAVVPKIAKLANTVRVKDARISDESIVHVVLSSDPGRGGGTGQVSISWIRVTPGEGFDVNLTGPAQQTVDFRYFITEPC